MRGWLKLLFDSYLPQLQQLKPTSAGIKKAKAICIEMREKWAAQGKRSLTQQKPLMDEVRAAIKQQFAQDSWLLDYIRLEREEYFEINQKNAEVARLKQMQQQYLTNPDAIVAKAVRLLESPEWKEVACALSVLTGRRLNEVLHTAEFEIKSKWIVTFRGALKRRDEAVELVFDIPTLTTAQRIIDGILKLREITPDDANEAAIAEVSDRLFADLVPAPPGKGKLYTHLWRSVYACIATFWYCPKHCDDLLFKAHILGHFQTLSADEMTDTGLLRARLETFASDRHYRLYEIDDDIIAQHGGKRKGIKLGHGGVVPLAAFREALPEAQPIPQERRQSSSIRIWQTDRDRLHAIFDQLEITEGNLSNRMEQLINWLEVHLQSTPEPAYKNGQVDAEKVEEQLVGVDQENPEAIALEDEPKLQEKPELTPPLSPLEAKLDTLVETMQTFIQIQMQAGPANPQPRPRRALNLATEGVDYAEMPRPRRSRAESDHLLHQAIDQIMQWNDTPGRPHEEKWAITINALKSVIQSQAKILRILDQRQEEIKAHHAKHQINPDKHNYRHRGKRSVIEILNNSDGTKLGESYQTG
jgi:hypothetical protein